MRYQRMKYSVCHINLEYYYSIIKKNIDFLKNKYVQYKKRKNLYCSKFQFVYNLFEHVDKENYWLLTKSKQPKFF